MRDRRWREGGEKEIQPIVLFLFLSLGLLHSVGGSVLPIQTPSNWLDFLQSIDDSQCICQYLHVFRPALYSFFLSYCLGIPLPGEAIVSGSVSCGSPRHQFCSTARFASLICTHTVVTEITSDLLIAQLNDHFSVPIFFELSTAFNSFVHFPLVLHDNFFSSGSLLTQSMLPFTLFTCCLSLPTLKMLGLCTIFLWPFSFFPHLLFHLPTWFQLHIV